jgi:hypothetical protein
VNLVAEVYVVLEIAHRLRPHLGGVRCGERRYPQGQRQVNLSKLVARQPEFSPIRTLGHTHQLITPMGEAQTSDLVGSATSFESPVRGGTGYARSCAGVPGQDETPSRRVARVGVPRRPVLDDRRSMARSCQWSLSLVRRRRARLADRNFGNVVAPPKGSPTMALSDQLTKLAARAKEAEDRVAGAQNKARSDLEKDVKTARESAKAQADELSKAVENQKGKLSAWWASLQRSWTEHVAEIRRNIDERRASHDVEVAQREADGAEEDAVFAVNYAYAAIEEAEYAVLDARLARMNADELGAGSTS